MSYRICRVCNEQFESSSSPSICDSCSEKFADMDEPSRSFVVRMPGASYAYKFHTNACGRQAQAVADNDATKFVDRMDAIDAAARHGLRFDQYEIAEVQS